MCSSILLLLCSSLATSSISISQSSPSSRVVVKEGSPTTLSCTADSPWFLCLWTSPGREKQCAIREGNTTRSVCQGEAGLSLEGGRSSCSLTIDRVTREDWGQWMCLLQDPNDFLTDRRLLEVQVARRGQLHLEGEGVVHLTEGQTLSVTCTVKGAFPRPSFSWLHSEGANLTVQEEDSHLWQEQEHTFLSRSTVTFTALRNETNSSLSCLALQEEGGQELFRLSGRVVLEVAPLAVPLAYSLGSGVGVVLGVILTLVFLLLVCVAGTAVMCRRQRQQQGSSRSSSSSGYQHDSLSPVWTTSSWNSRSGGDKKHVGVNVTPSYDVNVTPLYGGNVTPSYGGNVTPSYSVVNLSGEGGLTSSSQHSILTDSSPRGPSLAPAPSLHETHFGDSVEEPPVTLLHPPGLVLHLPPRSYSLLQGMDGRMAGEGWPCCQTYYSGSR